MRACDSHRFSKPRHAQKGGSDAQRPRQAQSFASGINPTQPVRPKPTQPALWQNRCASKHFQTLPLNIHKFHQISEGLWLTMLTQRLFCTCVRLRLAKAPRKIHDRTAAATGCTSGLGRESKAPKAQPCRGTRPEQSVHSVHSVHALTNADFSGLRERDALQGFQVGLRRSESGN